MRAVRAFEEWAADGRDRDMAVRHWHTAKHALAAMPVESHDAVLDLGCGRGYASRALAETRDAHAVGVDGAERMVRNARRATDDDRVSFVRGAFQSLPFAPDSFAHCFSMEAFYYASDPQAVLAELRRVVRTGGTLYIAVNYYEENVHSHGWADALGVEMVRWSAAEYRDAIRAAGLSVAGQTTIPDREIDIPPAESFPYEGPATTWESREAMVDRYRELGTLLTVAVVQ